MDYDHSVDSDTIQISAYITPTIGSEGTDVSTGLLKFFCIISTLDTGIITQQSLLNLSFKTIKKEKNTSSMLSGGSIVYSNHGSVRICKCNRLRLWGLLFLVAKFSGNFKLQLTGR